MKTTTLLSRRVPNPPDQQGTLFLPYRGANQFWVIVQDIESGASAQVLDWDPDAFPGSDEPGFAGPRIAGNEDKSAGTDWIYFRTPVPSRLTTVRIKVAEDGSGETQIIEVVLAPQKGAEDPIQENRVLMAHVSGQLSHVSGQLDQLLAR